MCMAFRISWSCAPGLLGVSFQGSWIGRDSQGDWHRTDSHQALRDPTRAQRLFAFKPSDGHPSALGHAQGCLGCDSGEAPCPVLPSGHTTTDMEEPLCLSPSCSSALNASGCSHSHGEQALLHRSGFACPHPCAPVPASPALHHVSLCCWASFFPC